MQYFVCEQIALFEQSVKAWVEAIIVLHFYNRSTGMVSSFMTVFQLFAPCVRNDSPDARYAYNT